MKTSYRLTAVFVLALLLAQSAPANLVTDGDFTGVNYTGSASLSPTTPLYGQFGTDGGTPASGSTLTVTGWATGGYNFVYSAANADQGTQASGGNSASFQEAPGQALVGSYGNTYLWGKNNGGVSTITAPPGGGNFIAADGAYEIAAITQTITGLTVGQTYALKFYFGGAQQQGTGFTDPTTEQWTVTMGNTGTHNYNGTYTTTTINDPSESFTGWTLATMYFQAGATSETLSFLASGTPNGEPPFALLADVDLEVVPDFSNWAVFVGFGVLCIGLEVMRRRRRRSELAPAA